MKKKPLVSVHHQEQSLDREGAPPSWVTAVAALPNSDLVASGTRAEGGEGGLGVAYDKAVLASTHA